MKTSPFSYGISLLGYYPERNWKCLSTNAVDNFVNTNVCVTLKRLQPVRSNKASDTANVKSFAMNEYWRKLKAISGNEPTKNITTWSTHLLWSSTVGRPILSWNQIKITIIFLLIYTGKTMFCFSLSIKLCKLRKSAHEKFNDSK